MKFAISPRQQVALADNRRMRSYYWRIALTLLLGVAFTLAGLVQVARVRAGSPDLPALSATWTPFYAVGGDIDTSEGLWDAGTEEWTIEVPGEVPVTLVPDTSDPFSCASTDALIAADCTEIAYQSNALNPLTVTLSIDGAADQIVLIHWVPADVSLTGITPSSGSLYPTFDPLVKTYELMTTDASITMDISVSEATGPLTWCLLLDLCSDSFSLNIGQNTFEIHTSSQFAPTIGGVPDTLKRNTDQYTITIIRNAILTFDAQGGDCDTTMQDQNDAVLIDFPASCSLALNSFAGWNTAPDGSGVTYEPGDTWPFFTVGSGTLYAQWTPVADPTTDPALSSLGVTLDRSDPEDVTRTATPSDATFNSDVLEYSVTTTANSLTLLPVLRSGTAIPECTYESDDPVPCISDGSGAVFPLVIGSQDILVYTTADDTTTHASYVLHVTRTTATVSFDGGAGPNGSCPTPQTASGAAVALKVNTCAYTGHVFESWNTVENGSGTAFGDGDDYNFPYDGSRTLYAQWNLAVYDVTFDAGDGDAVDPVAYTYGEAAIELPDSLREGYLLVGWYNGASLVGVAGANFTPTVSVELVAHWDAVVTFDGNGGEGCVATQHAHADEVALTDNTCEYEGFVFDGWTTEEDGTGDAYDDADTYDFLTNGPITLYAQWTEDVDTSPSPSTTPTPSASHTPKPSNTPKSSNSPSPVPSPSVTPTPAPSVSPSASPDGGWVLGNWDDISKVLGIALLASGGLLLLAALRLLFVAVAGRRSRRKYADEEWSRYNV